MTNQTTPSGGEGRPANSFARTTWLWTKEISIVVVGALIASTLLRLFLAQMFVIPSGSMENTLMVRDRVMVQKVAGWGRGDVVVFRDTEKWLVTEPEKLGPVRQTLVFLGLAPDESTNHLIKRVIGMPGDRVQCCDAQGRLLVNGYPLDETSYLYTTPDGRQIKPSDFEFQVVVPRDRIFVMGDHRNNSQDSRCHLDDQGTEGLIGSPAFVPTANVVGSTVAVVFPFYRWRVLTRPTTFEGVPAPAEPAPEVAQIIGPPPPC
ncbi:MAG: signal peptidase I [Micropruina sp.]